MSQGFTKNFAQLAAVRFILGLVEGKQSISIAVLLVFEHNANNHSSISTGGILPFELLVHPC